MKQWIDRIRVARSAGQVVQLVRDYLATWTPSEIGEIPPAAWPGAVSSEEEITAAAVQAKFEELRFTEDSAARAAVHELVEILGAAASRFGQLSSPFRVAADTDSSA